MTERRNATPCLPLLEMGDVRQSGPPVGALSVDSLPYSGDALQARRDFASFRWKVRI